MPSQKKPLFYAEIGNIFSSEDFNSDSLGDSMTSGRSLLQQVKMIVQFSPAFLANLAFKIGSIAIISTFLKGYVIIYMCLGIIMCTIVAF